MAAVDTQQQTFKTCVSLIGEQNIIVYFSCAIIIVTIKLYHNIKLDVHVSHNVHVYSMYCA